MPRQKTILHDSSSSRALRTAAANALVLSGVFIVLGLLLMWVALVQPQGIIQQVLACANSLFLIGPGVLYFLSWRGLVHRRPSALLMARRAALSHVIAVVASLGLIAGIVQLGLKSDLFLAFATPAGVMVFFIPALIAFMVETRARSPAAEALDHSAGRAFTPIVAEKDQSA